MYIIILNQRLHYLRDIIYVQFFYLRISSEIIFLDTNKSLILIIYYFNHCLYVLCVIIVAKKSYKYVKI